MTMDGVSSANFETIKDELTAITAKSLGVPNTSVKLTLKETDNMREGGTVINVEISIKDEDDTSNIVNAISTGSFTETMNEEVRNSTTLSTAGIVVESTSTPIVKKISGN